jgi:hypothetical protein
MLVSMGRVEKSGLGSRKITREEITGEESKTLPGEYYLFGLSQHDVSDEPLAVDPFRYFLKESESARLELQSILKTEITSKFFSCQDTEPLSYDFDKPP